MFWETEICFVEQGIVLTCLSEVMISQVHNFLGGSRALDGGVGEGEDGGTPLERLQGRESLGDRLFAVVGAQRTVGGQAFR